MSKSKNRLNFGSDFIDDVGRDMVRKAAKMPWYAFPISVPTMVGGSAYIVGSRVIRGAERVVTTAYRGVKKVAQMAKRGVKKITTPFVPKEAPVSEPPVNEAKSFSSQLEKSADFTKPQTPGKEASQQVRAEAPKKELKPETKKGPDQLVTKLMKSNMSGR